MELLTAHQWLLIQEDSPETGWTIYAGVYPSDMLAFGEEKIRSCGIGNHSTEDLIYELHSNQISLTESERVWFIQTLTPNELVISVGKFVFTYVPLLATQSASFQNLSKRNFSDLLMSKSWTEERDEKPQPLGFQEMNRVLFLNQKMRYATTPSEFSLMIQCFFLDTYYGTPIEGFDHDTITCGWRVGMWEDTLLIKLFDFSSGKATNFHVLSLEADSFQIGHSGQKASRRFYV